MTPLEADEPKRLCCLPLPSDRVALERLDLDPSCMRRDVGRSRSILSKLEELQPQAALRGILPDCFVTVVGVQWFGSEALELPTFTQPARSPTRPVAPRGHGASTAAALAFARFRGASHSAIRAACARDSIFAICLLVERVGFP